MLSQNEITATLLTERLAIVAFLSTVVRNYHLAEDVFQDICVKAIVHKSEFESTTHLVNWARTIGRNRAVDLLRARDGKYQGLSMEVLDALSTNWPKDHPTKFRERHQALLQCMEKLTPNNREVLRLRYFEGRNGSDVAKTLGRKLETVYQMLARIHKSLSECVRQRILLSEGEL